jgi:hypothetical protein
MRRGERDMRMAGRAGERIFVLSCAVVFLVIAACAVYFVCRSHA